ncbi:flavin-containing monooxygenase [Paraburkholderia sp. BR10936]|uniref:flavin-containing monooxygenase n=1 Tax=Paraburkholderia sp. BR10936 TaxID=3236993 RepID=UPI0034D24ACA
MKVKTIIVGTGFGGLATAIKLKLAGEQDFLLIERASGVGGVWRDNHYPGCACDVQSHLYSFSFALKPDWSREFASQPEIHAYLNNCVDRFGIRNRIVFNAEVTRMDWREDTGEWLVTTTQGNYRARFVAGAFGSLSDPDIPALRGLESFRGEVFHSATWNPAFRHAGKRAAVIGTGASAIQIVPAIQPEVSSLVLFQRTAPWVLPRHDEPIPAQRQNLYRRSKLAMKWNRMKIYTKRELFVFGFRNPALMRRTQKTALAHLHGAISSPELRAKLTPDYALGCKRILISNTYYPALAKKNVEVVNAGVRQVTETGVVDATGTLREVDFIVFGTGFKTKEPPFASYIFDAKGETLSSAWAGSPKAYLGTTIVGFPNLFLLHGPNTGLGHTSVIYMLEAQAEHIVKVIQFADRARKRIIEPKRAAQAAFVDFLDSAMKGTVWTAGGCESWYLDKTGRNSSLWPSFTFTFAKRARHVSEDAYALRDARVPE